MLFERVLSACTKSVCVAVAALVLALGCGQTVTVSAQPDQCLRGTQDRV